METIPLPALVLDFDLYPRNQVDSQNVARLAAALRAGVSLSPIVADRATKRIVDGFHRYRAYGTVLGPEAEVAVEWRDYESDADLFLDAVRLNAAHGRQLSSYDRAHIVLRAEALGLTTEQVATSLGLQEEVLGELHAGHTAKVGRVTVPIKRTLRHLAGSHLTRRQAQIIPKLGGHEPLYYVNQLIMLIEAGLLDEENDRLMAGLARLRAALDGKAKRRSA